jgi:hypothetical protein
MTKEIQMTKSKFKVFALAVVVFCAGGCVSVPQTKIAWTSARGTTASLKAPKDVELKGLKLSFVKGQDGEEHPIILIDEYKARTNPDVVDKASAGQVQIVNAWKGVLSEMVNAAVAGYTGKPLQAATGPAAQGASALPLPPQQQPQLIFVPTNLGAGALPQSANSQTNAPPPIP